MQITSLWRLYLGGAIDVGDDIHAGMPRLVGGQLGGVARLGQRAAGVHVGQENFFLRIHDLRRLGHEMDAAKENDVGLGRLRLIGEAERIAHVIGHFLDFAHLVIVRENHRVLFLFQGQDFILERTHHLILTHGAIRV